MRQSTNPKPQTLKPKPYTPNPKPQTLNPTPFAEVQFLSQGGDSECQLSQDSLCQTQMSQDPPSPATGPLRKLEQKTSSAASEEIAAENCAPKCGLETGNKSNGSRARKRGGHGCAAPKKAPPRQPRRTKKARGDPEAKALQATPVTPVTSEGERCLPDVSPKAARSTRSTSDMSLRERLAQRTGSSAFCI